MNRTLIIFKLFLSSVFSTAIPLNESTTEHVIFKLDDQIPQISHKIDDILPALARTEDVISTSNLNKVYTTENKYARTQSLKEEKENEGFKNTDLKQEIRSAGTEIIEKINDPEEKSSFSTEAKEIERKVGNTEGSKSSTIIKTAAKLEIKSKTAEIVNQSAEELKSSKINEEIKTTRRINNDITKKDTESKESIEEKSKTVEDDLEKTTSYFRRSAKETDYLENNEDVITDKLATDENYSERPGHRTFIEDESNSSWDLLDDFPASRRMFAKPEIPLDEDSERTENKSLSDDESSSQYLHDDLPTPRRMMSKYKLNNSNIDNKAISGNDNIETIEARTVPEKKMVSSNHKENSNNCCPPVTTILPTPQFRSTVPYIHPAVLPGRHFNTPGRLKDSPPVNFRRQMNQGANNGDYAQIERPLDRSHLINEKQNVPLEPKKRLEIPPESSQVEDYDSEDRSNAYPYTPNVNLDIPKTSNVIPIVAKLIKASEHPHILSPVNGENLQNFPNIPNLQNFPNIPNLQNNPKIPNLQNFPNIPNLLVRNIKYSNNINPTIQPNYLTHSGRNIQNYPGIPFKSNYVRPMNNFAVPQNYGLYKYVTEYGRPLN